jgi:hypothetical protein
MKNTFIIKLIVILFIFSPTICFSIEKDYTYELEFGDPGAKKILQIGGNGDLNITGYEGKKILISADENVFEEDSEVKEKTKGLKKLGGGGFNIMNDKKENCIIISRSIIGDNIDLDIKVPNDITLRLGSGGNLIPQEPQKEAGESGRRKDQRSWWRQSEQEPQKEGGKPGKGTEKNNSTAKSTGNNSNPYSDAYSYAYAYTPPAVNGIITGDILIKDLTGTIEINTIQGDIIVENIKGAVTASSVQGSLKIVFNKLSADNALYFSTVNGEIDITLPKGAAADIMAKALNGDVYSGFEGEITTENVLKDQTLPQNMVNNFSHPNYIDPNYIASRINGGGQKLYLSTIRGNIYIRKGE